MHPTLHVFLLVCVSTVLCQYGPLVLSQFDCFAHRFSNSFQLSSVEVWEKSSDKLLNYFLLDLVNKKYNDKSGPNVIYYDIQLLCYIL